MTSAPNVVLRLAFTITGEDLVDAQRAYNRNLQRKAVFVGGLVAVLGPGLWFITGWMVGLAIGLLGLIALVSGQLRFVDRWLIARTFANRVGQNSEFRIDDVGIHHKGEGTSASIEWFTITEIREDERAILFLQGPLAVAGIPKRVFASSDEIAALRQLIHDRAPNARIEGRVTGVSREGTDVTAPR